MESTEILPNDDLRTDEVRHYTGVDDDPEALKVSSPDARRARSDAAPRRRGHEPHVRGRLGVPGGVGPARDLRGEADDAPAAARERDEVRQAPEPVAPRVVGARAVRRHAVRVLRAHERRPGVVA